jgi:hypothetical protein
VAELAIEGDAQVAPHRNVMLKSSRSGEADELTIRFRDGLTCPECGSSKIKHTGSCATCLNCGASLGCS